MKHASEPLVHTGPDRRITVKIGAGNGQVQTQRQGQVPGQAAVDKHELEQGRERALVEKREYPAGAKLTAGSGAAPGKAEPPKPAARAEWHSRPAPAPAGRGSTARWPVTARRRGGGGPAALLAGLAALAALALLLPALLTSRAGDTPPPPDAGPAAAVQAPALPEAAAAAALAQQPKASAPGTDAEITAGTASAAEPEVRVYLSRTGKIETLPLEQYVTGVLAAEMPADFELAALKAQAIAARTFIVRRLAAHDTSGVPGGKADVLDTVDHQAYISRKTLDQWSEGGKAEKLAKLEKAVADTRGIIMTYRGQPITAAFFSASGGYTENSEDYWTLKIPYLRSVPSPWEAQAKSDNQETVTVSIDEIYQKLGQAPPTQTASTQVGSGSSKNSSNAGKASTGQLTILSHTTGGRVKEIKVGNQRYSGREFREKLGLRSSQFTITVDGAEARITTYGYGHGVGMSQWGANGMAKQGYTTTQILRHYYTGISFQQADSVIE